MYLLQKCQKHYQNDDALQSQSSLVEYSKCRAEFMLLINENIIQIIFLILSL